jgi:hypothetical protein
MAKSHPFKTKMTQSIQNKSKKNWIFLPATNIFISLLYIYLLILLMKYLMETHYIKQLKDFL